MIGRSAKTFSSRLNSGLNCISQTRQPYGSFTGTVIDTSIGYNI